MLTIERSLNIYAAGIPQIISLSQYDDDFQLVFTLYTSEGEFTIPSGTTAEVMGTKVDGNGYSASASISGSTVTVTGNKQMTACAGRNVYEIVLTNSGKRLATVNFILKVERAALDADTIQSETVLKELNAIIDSAATATEAAETATAAAESAAESARTLTIDPTLTQSGQAADAKVTGDRIKNMSGLSNEAKTALLNCFAHVAWTDEHGQTYYDALETALNNTGYPMISAVFNQGANIIYEDATLESLKQYLTVKYFESSESEGTVVPSTGYTLSGTLSVGLSVITVMYNNMTSSFTVTVSERLYIWDGDEAQGTPQRWNDKDAIHGVSPSDYTVVNGYGVRGYIERAGAYPQDSAQRATSIDSIIIGDFDGKTLGLMSYTLSSGATVNYGIWYGYINPNTNAFNGTQYVEAGTDDVYVFGKWLGASVTLPTNNSKVGKRVLMMAFKIANDTRDFTQAELEEIPTLINIS